MWRGPGADGAARVHYVAPGTALAREGRVVAVRLWLRIRADATEPGFQDDSALSYANVHFTPSPIEARQRRMLVERTVALRNVRAAMKPDRQRGTTLVVGLLLLAVVTLLGLAGADSAHIERQLARNEQFRENAASAASAGIEYAISRIVSSPPPDSDAAPVSAAAPLPGSRDRFETVTRFAGYEAALPQARRC